MKPIIIAECCQNHNGSREILKRMIHEATEAGADYVKIQAIRSRELTHRERFDTGNVGPDGITLVMKRPYQQEFERLSKLDLTLDDEAWFVDECLRAGVQSMTTAFTRGAVQEVKEMGFDAIKIASYDCASFPLLQDIRKWWSKIVVSTGATFNHEIAQAASELRGTDFAFLHCVTIYPTELSDLNLRRMNYLRRYTPHVGFSDHTLVSKNGLVASKAALAFGADLIERHFTVLSAAETKDGPVSITPTMLKDLRMFANLSRFERMQALRREQPECDVTLGSAVRDLTHAELLNRDYYRGRFATKRNGQDVYNWEEDL